MLFFGSLSYSQVLINEDFDALGDPFVLPSEWSTSNQSVPVGTIGWFRGGGGTTFGGYNGGQNGYIGANFNNTAGVGVISNWLMSPELNLINGDIITFYTRTATGTTWADNLEMRISTDGLGSADPVGSTGVGSYTILALTVNPTFPAASGYPQEWTMFSYTVSGIATETPSRIAFRYTVPTSAGPSGNNSNFIGIDAFNVNRPTASAQDFFANQFSMYPNPAKNVLNLSVKNGLAVNEIALVDLNGRTVKKVQSGFDAEIEINVSDLTAGVYMINIKTTEGIAISKFIKN